jgi:hypothetical protein
MYLGVAAGALPIFNKSAELKLRQFPPANQPPFNFITLTDLYGEFLPARLARLACVALIVITTATPAPATKSLSAFDKGEAARAAGFAIRNNADALDCSVRLEYAAQFRLGGAMR